MPLSPRFEELINGLELKDALWHLQRANSGENQATETEITQGYSRILQLVQNIQDCVTVIFQNATHELENMPRRELLLQDRDKHMRDIWARRGNPDDYQKTIHDLTEHVRLSRLQKKAKELQEGKGIQVEDIESSIHSLPSEINKVKVLKILGLEQTESEIPSQAVAA